MDTGAAVIEALLLRWGESPAGRTVTFLLPDDGTTHPFKGLKTGPSYGQRVALSVALIADDETQVPALPGVKGEAPGPDWDWDDYSRKWVRKPAKAAHDKKRWSDLALSAQAAIRCGENGFLNFLGVQNSDEAAEMVRAYCGTSSRANIKPDTMPGRLWQRLEGDYQEWLRTPG